MPGRFIESAAFEVNENEFVQYEAAFPFKEKANTDSKLQIRNLYFQDPDNNLNLLRNQSSQ